MADKTGTFSVPYQRIGEATTDATRAEAKAISGQATSGVESLAGQLSGYGGEGTQTGAFIGATADIMRQRDVAIADVVQKYSIQRENIIGNRENQLQTMIAQGYVDPATGNLLRSAYTMDLDRMAKQFEYQMKLLDKQQETEGRKSMMGGLGMIAGYALGGPLGGMLAGGLSGGNNKQSVSDTTGGFSEPDWSKT